MVEHSGGRTARVPLTPHRPVGAVTRDVLAAVRDLGGPVRIDPAPQEVSWRVPLDADDEHAHYDQEQVAAYFAAATLAAQVLAANPGALPRALHPGQRLVGILRPGGQPVLRPARRTPVEGLHHAQCDGRAGGRGGLVAGRRTLRPGRVLRVRAPGPGRASTAPTCPPRAGKAGQGEPQPGVAAGAASDLPDALTRQLRQLLPYDIYELQAQAQLSSQEGQAVAYDMGNDYEVSFRVGTLLDAKNLKLSNFAISRRAPGPGRRPTTLLARGSLMLRLDQHSSAWR